VRRWLKGYDYLSDSTKHHMQPVVHRKGTSGTGYASFLDLVDLLFVKKFIDEGISLQRVRKALNEASLVLGTGHFARQLFYADNKNIYLQLRKEGNTILQLLSGGQQAIPSVIEQLTRQIVFDTSTGLAARWFPQGPEGLIVLDPRISFGRPSIVKKGIATETVYDLYMGGRKNQRNITDWLNLTNEEVEAAIQYEERIAA
jgi:uncharacterized protein (DUF433 family)